MVCFRFGVSQIIKQLQRLQTIQLETVLLWVIRICSYFILVLPLLVDSATVWPAVFPKVIYFNTLVEIAGTAWLVLILFNGRYRPNFFHPIVASFTLLVVALLATSFTSQDVQRSFFSTTQWGMGSLTYAHFWLWFLILITTLRTWHEWRRILVVSVMIGVLVGMYGVAQALDVRFLFKEFYAERFSSTIANPIYFAAYIMMNAFFALLLYVDERRFIFRAIWAACFLSFSSLILVAGSRGVFVAYAIMLALLILIFIKELCTKRQRLILSCSFFLLTVLASGLILFFQSERGRPYGTQLPQGVQKIAYLNLYDEPRVLLARIGLRAFLERPLVGLGPDNYALAFFKYVNPKDYGTRLSHAWYDKAHNSIIEILSTTGVIGLIASLVLWYSVFFSLAKAVRTSEKKKRMRGAIFMAAIAAYLVQNLSAFDTPAPFIMLTLSLSGAFFISKNDKRRPLLQIVADRFMKPSRAPLNIIIKLAAAIIIIIAFTGIIVFYNIIPYQKVSVAKSALSNIDTDVPASLASYRAIFSSWSYIVDDMRLYLAKKVHDTALDTTFSEEQRRALLAFSISQIENTVRARPYNLEFVHALVALYRVGSDYSPEYGARGLTLLTQSIARYPKRRDLYYERAALYMKIREPNKAIKDAEHYLSLDPERGDAYFLLASIYRDVGEFEKMYTELRRAKIHEYPVYDNSMFPIILAQTLPPGQNDKAFAYLENGLRLFPGRLDLLGARAILYVKAGNDHLSEKDITVLTARNRAIAETIKTLILRNKKSKK